MKRLALISAGLLLLGACAQAAALDEVSVSDGEIPAVTNAKVSVDNTTVRVITEGDGEEIEAGDLISVNYIAINGRTGDEFYNSFATQTPMTLNVTEGRILLGFVKALDGAKIGSRLLVAIPPKDGFAGANSQFGLEEDDTMVFLFDILNKISPTASGKEIKAPEWVPSFALADGQPTDFAKTATTPDEVDEFSAHVIIKGEGPEVKAGQSITVHYHGQIFPDGVVFDSSWAKQSGPATFQIGAGAVIKCWDEGLVGQTVGSRLILICPSNTAYGDTGQGDVIKPGDTLIFAVDLLAAN